MFQFVRNHVLPNWKSIIVVLAPLLLLPLPLSRMKVVDLTIRQQESDMILKNFQIFYVFFIHYSRLYSQQEAECGYVILIMAIFWMTEALPLPVTSLIPVVALPLFGIMETSDVSTAYMKAIIDITLIFKSL